MQYNYGKYLYILPDNWCSEEDGDGFVWYNPNGEGAMVVSVFSILENRSALVVRISEMAKRFVDQNHIRFQFYVNQGTALDRFADDRINHRTPHDLPITHKR